MLTIIAMAIREAVEARRAMKAGEEAIREAERESRNQEAYLKSRVRTRRRHWMAGFRLGRH